MVRLRRAFVPLLLSLGLALCGPARSPAATATQWTWRSLKVSGTTIRYAVTLPPGFRRGGSRTVLLAFPPGGQTADLVEVGMRAYWSAEGARRGWVVISPVAPGGRLFYDRSAALIEPFRAAAQKDLGVVPGHVALGGISNGGLSAFRAAIDHPERYVALVTLPGALPGGNDADQAVKLRSMRIGLWVGENDTSWRSAAQFVYDTLAGLSSTKVDIALHVLPGQGHILSGVAPSDVWDSIAPR
jgi:pimeloyl-ACP methyl ester carboxylesterase